LRLSGALVVVVGLLLLSLASGDVLAGAGLGGRGDDALRGSGVGDRLAGFGGEDRVRGLAGMLSLSKPGIVCHGVWPYVGASLAGTG
jgi:hypothetical protein